MNSERKLQIYGLFTDRSTFSFYLYDPWQERFFFDKEIFASGPRKIYLTHMIAGMSVAFEFA